MNKHLGSSFDDFLMEEGLLEEVSVAALERAHDFLQRIEWEDQQRQVKENLKSQIDGMLVEEVEFSDLQDNELAVSITIKGQLKS